MPEVNLLKFDISCPYHLTDFCIQKSSKLLKPFSIQVDDFVIDLFCHFKRSMKRKATLRDYMEFTKAEVKKMIKHVTTSCC